MKITDELLEGLLDGVETQGDLFGKDRLVKNLTGCLLEKMLEGEMNDHLGYKKHSTKSINSGNSRNGYSKKTLKSSTRELDLQIPRDKNSHFTPELVIKNCRYYLPCIISFLQKNLHQSLLAHRCILFAHQHQIYASNQPTYLHQPRLWYGLHLLPFEWLWYQIWRW